MNNQYKLYIFSNTSNEYQELEIESNDMLTIFSLENIQDITARKDAVAKDITIKGTDNNNKVLGNLYDISRYSDDTYTEDLQHNFVANRYVKCILLENNIQILKGSLLVKEIDVDENGNVVYSCGILGNLVTFFGNINDLELSDLDSIKDGLQYNISTVMQSWSSSTLPFVLPSIDYGIDDRNNWIENDIEKEPNHWDSSYNFKNFRPAIYVKTYLDAIFKGFRFDEESKKWTQIKKLNDDISVDLNLYTYQSSLLSDSSFKKIFIPYNAEQFTYEVKERLTTVPSDNFIWPSIFTQLRTTPIIIIPIRAEQANSKYFTSYDIPSGWRYWEKDKNNYAQTSSPFKVLKTKDKYLKSTIRITATLSIPPETKGKYKFGLAEITSATGAKKVINEVKYAYEFTKTSNQTETFNAIVQTEIQDIGGEFILVLKRDDVSNSNDTGIVTAPLQVNNINISIGSNTTISEIPYAEGDNIKLLKCIPKGIKIKDFLKSIMTLYNLYMVQDPENENNWILEPYDTFYKNIINLNRNDAIDWTGKIDFKNYKIKTNIALPKAYTYKYKEDSDMLNDFYKNRFNKVYGEYTITDSKGYTEPKEVETIFSPTINLNHSLDLKMMPVIYKADGFVQGKKKPFQSKLRILYNNGQRTTGTLFNIIYRDNVIYETSLYCYASMFYLQPYTTNIIDTLLFDLPLEYFTTDDVSDNYDITLFNKYHKNQITDLTDDNLKILECKAYLNETDIANLDFQKPIYIQTRYGNSYFKLLEVEYTDNNTESNIKLMSIQK